MDLAGHETTLPTLMQRGQREETKAAWLLGLTGILCFLLPWGLFLGGRWLTIAGLAVGLLAPWLVWARRSWRVFIVTTILGILLAVALVWLDALMLFGLGLMAGCVAAVLAGVRGINDSRQGLIVAHGATSSLLIGWGLYALVHP